MPLRSTRQLRGLRIEVQAGDILAFPCDLIVLKHAQELYGADQAFFQSLPRRQAKPILDRAPAPGQSLTIESDGYTAAPTITFVGTPRLYSLEYSEVRALGVRAVDAATTAERPVRHLALTVHGPGFGLDEEESFEALLAGLVEGAEARPDNSALERVTIVERDVPRSRRFQALLAELLPATGPVAAGPPTPAVEVSDRLETAGVSSDDKDHVFVAMPFSPDFDDSFRYGIQPVVRDAGLLCERVDESSFSGEIMKRIRNKIRTAVLVIADLTDSNPNVYLEVGFAWGCGVPTILVVRDVEQLKFDTKAYRTLEYTSIHELETKLSKELPAILKDAKV